MTVQIITFGCRLNSYESEIIKNHAIGAGLSDVIIVNSCAVTNEAERQLRQAIRKAKKSNSRAKIVVVGCAAQCNAKQYNEMEEVFATIGNSEKLNFNTYVDLANKLNLNTKNRTDNIDNLLHGFENRTSGFIQVQNGCDHYCSFCIIPYARGKSYSVPLNFILDQAKVLVNNGHKELAITGVDITHYGHDLQDNLRLGSVVKSLIKEIPDLLRIRLSSIDVAEIDKDLEDVILNESKLMPYLHISMQSGDDNVLSKMRRRHSRKQLLDFCNYIKRNRPEVVFGADIIAGFPTEDECMFQNTYSIIEEASIIRLHVFPYSERKGTLAARMTPQIPKPLRKHRAKLLRDLGEEMLKKHNIGQIGKRVKVLVENDNYGKTEDYSKIKLINDDKKYSNGLILDCEVTATQDNYLVGKIL